MTKKNCWEFKACGRQPGGVHAGDLGICPAATDTTLHGVHDGTGAGRACWVLAGTFCGGAVQGTFAQKLGNCQNCAFYQAVVDQETPNLVSALMLLRRIREHAA